MKDVPSVRQSFSPLINLRDSLALAICYVMAGYIGTSLAFAQGYAAAAWIASGD